MSIAVRAISDGETNAFIKSQWLFYKGDKNWVPPMLMDRKKLLNKKVNPFYKHSKMQLFLAEENGQVVGRIAAITNDNHNKTHNDKTGFYGFFECVNNQDVANALFGAAEQWLLEQGMDTMLGPVNPSLNDESGLLVDGFDGPPAILMTYNPPYYIQLHENAGLTKAKDLYAYLLENATYLDEKVVRLRNAVIQRYGLTFRSINLRNKTQFKKDVESLREIYNEAWEDNWGFVKMTNEEFDFLAADLKQIADAEFAFLVESKGKVAGFCLALPDINQSLIHNKNGGLLGGIFHLITKKKQVDLVRIIVLGVLPEYRGKGIDALMYQEIGDRAMKKGIFKGEASWILEDNVMMNRGLTETMKADRYRTYRLYSKRIKN